MLKLKAFNVPIYDAHVLLLVTDLNPEAISHKITRYNVKWLIDELRDCHPASAMCSYDGLGNFSLCFFKDCLTWDIVAHEVFHLTCRILNWGGIRYHPDNHEAYAALNGWLMHNVIKQLPLITFASKGYCSLAPSITMKQFANRDSA